MNRTATKYIYLIAIAGILTASKASASWLIYHKPAFCGYVFDADTNAPIANAGILADYIKVYYAFPSSGTITLKVHVTTTDKNGYFEIPSYTTLISPFSGSRNVLFIIYKPGYHDIDGEPIENYLVCNKDYQQSNAPIGQTDNVSIRPGAIYLRKWGSSSESKNAAKRIVYSTFIYRHLIGYNPIVEHMAEEEVAK
jgi:hypothetical protein